MSVVPSRQATLSWLFLKTTQGCRVIMSRAVLLQGSRLLCINGIHTGEIEAISLPAVSNVPASCVAGFMPLAASDGVPFENPQMLQRCAHGTGCSC